MQTLQAKTNAGPQVSVAVIIVTIIAVVYCCVLQKYPFIAITPRSTLALSGST